MGTKFNINVGLLFRFRAHLNGHICCLPSPLSMLSRLLNLEWLMISKCCGPIYFKHAMYSWCMHE